MLNIEDNRIGGHPVQSLYTVLSIGVGGGRGKGAEALTIFFKGGRPPIFDSNYSYYMYTPIHHLL